jgi:hypothetical protein
MALCLWRQGVRGWQNCILAGTPAHPVLQCFMAPVANGSWQCDTLSLCATCACWQQVRCTELPPLRLRACLQESVVHGGIAARTLS